MPVPEPVSALIRYILDENPMHKNFMQRALTRMSAKNERISPHISLSVSRKVTNFPTSRSAI